MAASDKNIIISPQRGSTTNQPTITLTGDAADPITLRVTDLSPGTLSFEGSAGQLFSITNNLTSGSIFSVNDVSGIPSLNIDANGTVSMGVFGGNVGIGTASPSTKLQVSGTTTTTILNVPLGSAGAPTITFTGDSNTGIYSPGADQLAFSTNGEPSLLIDSNGIVYAGRASANDTGLQLGVGATGNRSVYIDLIGDTTYTNYGLRLIRKDTGANANSLLTSRGTGSLAIATEEAGSLVFATNSIERARIDSSGKFGLGTDNPSVIFHAVGDAKITGDLVLGTTSDWTFQTGWSGLKLTDSHAIQATEAVSPQIVMTSNAAMGASDWEYTVSGITAGQYAMAGGEHIFLSASAGTDGGSVTWNERVRITSGGNVGFGVNTPSSLLHLADAGNIQVGTTTGTKIGTSASQKIGFFNATPVVQPAAIANATNTTAIAQFNTLLSRLRDLGLIAT